MSRRSAVKWGLPFVVLVVAGYTGLSQFMTTKVSAMDKRVKRRSTRTDDILMAEKVGRRVAAICGQIVYFRYFPLVCVFLSPVGFV